MYALYSFIAGLIFGIGLIVSEMWSPVKVLGFLDLFGKWDPSLLVVMGGAVAVGIVAFALAGRRTTTLINTPMHMPTARGIDLKLVAGSALFGIGWGLAGFCPGPALVALGSGHVKAFLFVVAMLAGMGIYELLERRRANAGDAGAAGAARKAHPHGAHPAPAARKDHGPDHHAGLATPGKGHARRGRG
jgi:uncharacterized membrane protein YedE/YeeE